VTNEVNPAILRQLLRYDPETGKLFWRKREASALISGAYARRFNTRFAGTEAFTALCSNGYKQGHVLSGKQLAHRVIWAIANGEWPDEIDHIDGDRANNCIANLRNVSRSTNCKNLASQARRASGHIGVRFTKGRWQASITANGKRLHLGRFEREADAIAARKAAERELGFHPNHGRAA
jgi:hypothetical protein